MVAPRFSLSGTQRIAWLRLIRTDNVGPIAFQQLINREGSAEAALEALPRLTRAPLRTPSVAEIEDEIAALAALGGRFVGLGEPDYPDFLSQIPGGPPMIAMIGGSASRFTRTLAIVGSRNASAAGLKLARSFAADLSALGYSIVSGLARGIDTAAHLASLQSGTIAVLPGGIDEIYPEENKPLAARIVEAGGTLIAEMPMGFQPRARDFPRRNRIISGLALGTIVIEAAERSGSLITARYALEQNREVFAVPGSPLDPRARGCNGLIRQGAHLVQDARDVLDQLAGQDQPQPLFEPDWIDEDDMGSLAPPSETDRARVLDALSYSPVLEDDLILATGIGPSKMQALLLELDLEGRIERIGGDMVALRP